MNNIFFSKNSQIFWECCENFFDQSCYTLSHCKLFYSCKKWVPFKALLFPANKLKFSTCWLQWLFKKKEKSGIPEPVLSNVDMNYMIKLTQISLCLIPVQPFLSTSQGPPIGFPTPFHIKSGWSSKRCSGFWIICTKWRLHRIKHVKCIVLTPAEEYCIWYMNWDIISTVSESPTFSLF